VWRAVTLEICVLIGWPLNFANIVRAGRLLPRPSASRSRFTTSRPGGRQNESAAVEPDASDHFSARYDSTGVGAFGCRHIRVRQHGKLFGALALTTLRRVLLFNAALMGTHPANIWASADSLVPDRRVARSACF